MGSFPETVAVVFLHHILEVKPSVILGDMAEGRPRGRPMDPAVGDAVLKATLDLLEERGYDAMRVEDVVARAGVGLGAVYRRWPGKRDLVIAALRRSAVRDDPPNTDDPEADLLAGLVAMADATAGSRGAMMLALLTQQHAELARAVREAKITPMMAANRQRLRRVVGDVDDLETRADAAVGLIVLRGLVAGAPLDEGEIRERVVPLMLAGIDHIR